MENVRLNVDHSLNNNIQDKSHPGRKKSANLQENAFNENPQNFNTPETPLKQNIIKDINRQIIIYNNLINNLRQASNPIYGLKYGKAYYNNAANSLADTGDSFNITKQKSDVKASTGDETAVYTSESATENVVKSPVKSSGSNNQHSNSQGNNQYSSSNQEENPDKTGNKKLITAEEKQKTADKKSDPAENFKEKPQQMQNMVQTAFDTRIMEKMILQFLNTRKFLKDNAQKAHKKELENRQALENIDKIGEERKKVKRKRYAKELNSTNESNNKAETSETEDKLYKFVTTYPILRFLFVLAVIIVLMILIFL